MTADPHNYDALGSAVGRAGLTHLALRCLDTRATARFYAEVCGMEIVHERATDTQPVLWVSARPLGLNFVLVLMSGGAGHKAPRMDHLGFTVESREQVDHIAEQARKLGILQDGPADLGRPVGYFVVVRDPDGNGVEFSVDQEIRF
jgi:catechol 2,3-dioxygenase-like lactoylglutathione lyase family enzyme